MICDSDTCAPQPFWPLPPKKTRKTAGQCPRSKLQIRSKTQKKKKKNKSENPIITLSLTPPCHRRWRLHLSSRIDQGMVMNLSSLLFGLCLCL